jgi:CBS domain-containing protein
VVGVVTDTDLLRLYAKNPLYLLRNVERARLPEDYTRYSTELAAMVETMVWGGLGPAQIGPVVSRLNDALAVRLIALAQEDLGPAPAPFAWIVFGSEGRQEQTLLTDQDNALVCGDTDGRCESYFSRLANRVVHGLMAAGVPPCPGGFMATNWRKSLAEWMRQFHQWLESPDPRALVEVLNFFDFRPVCGTLDTGALGAIVLRARSEPIFMAQLARASIGLQPPLTAFRHVKEELGGVDLKAGGLAPIVSLARLYALDAGLDARPTLTRVEGAVAAGTLSVDAGATLAEGFRFLLGLRLREQLRALRAGEPLRNTVALAHLESGDRQHLKDIFVAIRDLQRATALRYGVDRLA